MIDHDPEPATGRIFDAHVHVWSDPPPFPDGLTAAFDGSLEQLLVSMNHAGVDQACIATPTAMRGDERATESAVATEPSRFVGMTRLDCQSLVDGQWDLDHPTAKNARVDIRAMDASPASVEALCLAGTRVTGVLAIHGDPHSADVMGAVASARPGRWTLIDHFGRPAISAPGWGLEDIVSLNSIPNVAVKTPNLGFFSAQRFPWPDLGDVLALFIDAFGSDRVLWGSDWPLCTDNGTYLENLDAVRTLLTAHGKSAAIPAVLGDNAQRMFI